jgi:adenylate cyclase
VFLEFGVSASFSLTAGVTTSPSLPDNPSIVVLPFTNLSDDPQQEYFADGVVEDIITSLSRIKTWIFAPL